VQNKKTKDAWHQFEGLVFVLVAIHAAAFGFWCWLLYSSRRNNNASTKQQQQQAGGSGGVDGARSGLGGSSSAGNRSTRDILRAYHKSTIGKG
jgi:hypothetical protein